ncbi:MAG: hypothetical protein ABEI75_03185 [Halobaculum sp.]
MDLRDRGRRWLIGVRPAFARRIVVGSLVGGLLVGVVVPRLPTVQATLIGFDGRLSMALLGVTMATWAGYQTDGLVPAFAPAVCLELGLFLGNARIFLTAPLAVGFVVGGFGSFLGASLRRLRGPPERGPPGPDDV